MNILHKSARSPVALIAAMHAFLSPLAVAADGPAVRPVSVVFVHGAWADGSSWNEVIPFLLDKGLTVVSVQNPLSSLADDVAATRRAIELQPGPVLLVGHSWGGVVITEAGRHEKVAGLVYVAAFAPAEGESVSALLGNKDIPPPAGLAGVYPDASGYLWQKPENIADHFAQDLPHAFVLANLGRAAGYDYIPEVRTDNRRAPSVDRRSFGCRPPLASSERERSSPFLCAGPNSTQRAMADTLLHEYARFMA